MFARCTVVLRPFSASKSLFRHTPVVGYKSQYSLDKLYPNSVSKLDTDTTNAFKHTESDGENFSGYIPIDSLDIRYSKSSGAGGQHVNKVNSKVEVRFHVDSASWIPDWIKPNLIQNEKSRVTKDGYLIVTCEKTRKQMLNQADCLDKVRQMVWKAAVREYKPTAEETLVMNTRMNKAKQSILKEKKQHSQKKQGRQSPSMHSV